MIDLSLFPAVNASLNSLSAVLLISGYLGIRTQNIPLHKSCMMGAVLTSCLFLICYLYYHSHVGSVRFPATGLMRQVYLSILGSHTILAIVVIPLIVKTVWSAMRSQLEAHRKLARITFPIWLYVSVTGVVVYWLLYRSPWGVS